MRPSSADLGRAGRHKGATASVLAASRNKVVGLGKVTNCHMSHRCQVERGLSLD
jgi:hypothetical protein